MRLKNKTILITGATSGIGHAMLSTLYPENNLIVIARSDARLRELKETFSQVDTYQADLSNLNSVTNVCSQILSSHRHIDLLINNAAIQYTPTILDDSFSLASITEETMVNFLAPVYLIYSLMPLLQNAEHSIIVNVNSGLAITPKKSSAIYCASKSALDAFSKSLSYQLKNTKVSVYQAFLPLVDTAMTSGRGSGKISAQVAAESIISGVENNKQQNDIGKVKLLRLIARISPSIAQKLMENQ